MKAGLTYLSTVLVPPKEDIVRPYFDLAITSSSSITVA